MSAQNKLASDIVGLTTTAPLSRRGFFMTASAASAAGYTLAAGPVRAQVVTTDTSGLTVGEAKVKVRRTARCPVYFAKPANAQNPPVILVAMEIFGLHEYIKDVTRRLGQARRVRGGARLLFPQGRGPHQDHGDSQADAARQLPSRTRS